MADENAFQKDVLAFQDDAFQAQTSAVAALRYLRATLEEQSRYQSYRKKYRTYGRTE